MENYSYNKLIVWQKASGLAIVIYKMTDIFPKSELYGLTSQICRCVVSIVSNISEGAVRSYKKEFIQFLMTVFGPGAELETQLLLAKEPGFLSETDFNKANELLGEVMKMLNA